MGKRSTATGNIFSAKMWREVAKDIFYALGDKNLGMLGASIAFYATLSFFPLIASLVAIGGIVLEPHQMTEVANTIAGYLPQDIANLITTQLSSATQNKQANPFIAVFALTLALFSISGAVNTAMTATNIAYDMKETRHPVRLKIIGMFWALGLVISLAIILPVLFINQSFLIEAGMNNLAVATYAVIRWAALFALVIIGLAFFYHFGPNRSRTAFQWFSWGAVVATALWLLVTGIFFVYLQYFGNFSDSYSLFAGIIAMMLWLNLTSFIVLIGAEINHRLDKHMTRTR